MVSAHGTIEVSGPFFEAGKAKRETNAMILETVQDLVKVGQAETKSQLRPGHGFVTGDLQRGTRRRVNKKKLSGSVYAVRKQRGKANWIESGKSHRPTRFRGFHYFREGSRALDRQATGIGNKRARVLVRKLN